jgi:5-methyltetrahydropteroyltriglutamate--homocysteine methyltransferase
MTIASNLGFPRIGRRRELKSALERFWSGDLDEAGLADDARALRLRRANSFMEGMESATSRPEIA